MYQHGAAGYFDIDWTKFDYLSTIKRNMKTKILYLLSLLVFCLGCEQFSKKTTHKEISIEKKKINDSLTKATITTTYKTGEERKEEVKIIQGTPEEVNERLEAYKKETLEIEDTQATQSQSSMATRSKKLQFSLDPKSQSNATGMITLTEKNGSVTLEAHINGLSEGAHAIHIHQTADCSSEDGKSTGGHWNPTFSPHGAWGSENGFHRGDIGNFIADASGHGMIEFSTDLWCIGCEDETKNILGKAIIVHQGKDDLTSQPSGAAGARISCAGLIK